MPSPHISNLNFPYFPSPPYHPFQRPPPPAAKPPSPERSTPPPSHPLTPPPHAQPPLSPSHPIAPPPHILPPPTPHIHPPPTPSHPFTPPPHIRPQPPSHHFAPPPPHIHPVPPPSPSPSPDNHPTVIIIVFMSLGGLFFLTFLVVALFCYIKKRKNKIIEETDIIHVDEHQTIKEAIIPGPHGPRAVVLSIEDDVHIDEVIKKNERIGTEGLHAKSVEGKFGTLDQEGASSSSFDHHHQQLEHKA